MTVRGIPPWQVGCLNIYERQVIIMKTNILCRQVTVDDQTKAIIEKKLTKLDKFFKDGTEANVKLSRQRDLEKLEITISQNGTIFRSEVTAQSFCHAIDSAVSIIERQIRKNKTRLEKRLREGAFAAPAEEEEIEEQKEFTIKKKAFALKPMTAEEAILQMNLLDHSFFVYEDQDTGSVSVVYKRHDDEYGLITTDK